jgi:4-hydroxy-tetrahydrodipicolinate synthase
MQLNNYPLWTALITPLTHSFKVDFSVLTKLVEEQSEAGNGLLILGSTAEALNLSLNDRKAIIDHVLSLKPTSPIMVGVGGHQLEETMEWIKFLETKNIQAYLMVTPLYAKPGPIGQYQWFKALMDSVTRPCMLYNVPGRTAVALSVGAVKNLNQHPNFWAIKEASGSVEKFKEYLSAAGGKAVFCGDDALMPDFAHHGSKGLVSVASNAWPRETNLYVKQCLNKTFDDKRLWTEAADSLFVVSNPVPVKRLLFENGKIQTPFMIPPLSHEDMTDASPVLKSDLQIKEWFKRNKQ